jgi:hypothetical protein
MSSRTAYGFNTGFFSEVPRGLTAVPGTTTALTTTDTELFEIAVCNPTGSAVTFTLNDAAGNKIISAYSLAAGATQIWVFSEGVRLVGGIKWAGSTTGLIAHVSAWSRS